MNVIDLSGKTAVVTGGGQGLGRATAEALHAAGANVVINYLDDPGRVNAAKAEALVARLGSRAAAWPADVRDRDQLDRMFDQVVSRFGSLDILVNNAGVICDKTMKNMRRTDWDVVLETNLTGVFNACQAAVARMAAGGRIVNLASISAVIGFYGQANYAAAKAGVVGFTKVLSRELAKSQITVNAVAPGVVLTDMGQTIPEQVRREMLAQIPLGRLGEPQDVAGVILFLCSSLACYVTGQTLHVNGGWWG